LDTDGEVVDVTDDNSVCVELLVLEDVIVRVAVNDSALEALEEEVLDPVTVLVEAFVEVTDLAADDVLVLV
jgi:hypothetical protein